MIWAKIIMFSTLNFEVNVIEKISGQHDVNYLSMYDFDEYSSANESLENNYIDIVHINVRSLNKNFYLLKSFLKCLPMLSIVIVVTEKWLRQSTIPIYSFGWLYFNSFT